MLGRERVKRDLSLREDQVKLIMLKRRFRCSGCCNAFTEPDIACGQRRRTTVRLREAINDRVWLFLVFGELCSKLRLRDAYLLMKASP